MFVLTFKAYGPNAVRSMRLKCENKYFSYGPKSRLIRALLYTYPNKQFKMKLYCVRALFIVLVRCPVHTPFSTPMYGLHLSQSDQGIGPLFQSVYSNRKYSEVK